MNHQEASPPRNEDGYTTIQLDGRQQQSPKESSLSPSQRSVHFDDDYVTSVVFFDRPVSKEPSVLRRPSYKQSLTEEVDNATTELVRLLNDSVPPPDGPPPRSSASPLRYRKDNLPQTTAAGSRLTPVPVIRMDKPRSDSPRSNRSTAIISTNGSESPRSLREYHRGNGELKGGGVQEIYVRTKPKFTALPLFLGSKQFQLIVALFVGVFSIYRYSYEHALELFFSRDPSSLESILLRIEDMTARDRKMDMKKYKSKLDARLGQCIFICFLTIAVILCIYGVIHAPVHGHLNTYINRTHQIAQELKLAMDENYPRENQTGETDAKGRQWMTVEELEGYAELTRNANSTIWTLFWWNVFFCLLLAPVLILIHCEIVGGNVAKLAYRVVLVVCLIFAIGQFLYLIHPVLWGAAKFPNMIDRLFVDASPRDEYQLNAIQDDFACTFHPHETLVQFDLQTPCLPKIKNSLFPTYSVILLMILDLFPFAFAVFIYAWSACLKNSKPLRNARTRIELNNTRRVPFPKSNTYVPPSDRNVTLVNLD